MTNDLAIMLIGPFTALVAAALLGLFIMWRINRYGRVFKWPPISAKSNPPPAIERGDK